MHVRGLRGRMAADANFPFKLGAEVCLDEFMTVLVNVGVRGNPMEWALGAQLQVLCQMLTAAVNDIIPVLPRPRRWRGCRRRGEEGFRRAGDRARVSGG